MSKENKKRWEYKGLSPSKGGRIFHKKDRIMVVYSSRIRLFCDIPKDKPMFPCHAESFTERDSKGCYHFKN